MSAGLYLFFAFLFLFLSVICVGLVRIKQTLDLIQMEQNLMIGDSIRTNKKLMEYFDLYK